MINYSEQWNDSEGSEIIMLKDVFRFLIIKVFIKVQIKSN